MIGDTVRMLRERRGLTQPALAKALGVKQQNIEQLENNKVRQPRYIMDLAKFFGVSVDALYDGSATKKGSGASDIISVEQVALWVSMADEGQLLDMAQLIISTVAAERKL